MTTLVVHAIYPDDHWNFSTKLTVDNFDSTIQKEIDAGKTVFVRWIASPGWGWWRKQAAAWNAAVKAFAANNDVAFGDVNLKEERIAGAPHNPGHGGWPTIRYFNKKTGLKGGTYLKKTDKAMCQELGDEEYMFAYIEEYSNTLLCSAATGIGCDDKSKKFIAEVTNLSLEQAKSQLEDLEDMEVSSLKPDVLQWLNRRKAILRQIVGHDEL